MTRAFLPTPLDESELLQCIDLASRAPSAGKTQGWHLLVWEGEQVHQYWDVALPKEHRGSFAFPYLLQAPLIMLSLTDRNAYLERYAEPDKSHTALGQSENAWPAPYWTIDASFATMTFLLACENRGIGTLFFAHAHEEKLREKFSIPHSVDILGVIAAGYVDTEHVRSGRSASRVRRDATQIIHRSRW